MRIIDFNCRYCGNSLSAPEGAKRVLCGNCGGLNAPGKGSLKERFPEMNEIFPTRNENGKASPKGISDIPVKKDENNTEQEENRKTGPFSFLYVAIVIISSIVITIKEKFGKEIDRFMDNPNILAYLFPVIALIIFIVLFIIIKKGLAEFIRRNTKR